MPHVKERAWRSGSLRNQESRGLAAHCSIPVESFRTITQLGQTSRGTGKGLAYILLTLVKEGMLASAKIMAVLRQEDSCAL